MSQPLLTPLNYLDHFQILTRITNANSLHSAMQMISSPYRGPLSLQVGDQSSYTCIRDSPFSQQPTVRYGLPSIPPHPYKSLGLQAGPPTPVSSIILSLYEGWGQVDIFPQPLGLEALNNFRPSLLLLMVFDVIKQPLYQHLLFAQMPMDPSLASFRKILRKLWLFKPRKSQATSQVIVVPG